MLTHRHNINDVYGGYLQRPGESEAGKEAAPKYHNH